MQANLDPPRGIGGWLILWALGLVASPFLYGYMVILSFSMFGGWRLLTTPGTAAYHHLWAPVIIFSVIGSLVGLVLSLIALVRFFQKSRRAPMLMITLSAWGMIFVVVQYLFFSAIPAVAALPERPTAAGLIWTGVWAAIWIRYLLVSERVKATFVR